jgi:phosphoglycolate phosphatase-like HAD superfamily hydrolase
MSAFESIKTFIQIPMNYPKTLYVFDIDETFMVFRKITDAWWTQKLNDYRKYYDDEEKAQREMDKLFNKVITSEDPKPTDLNGFKKIEKYTNALDGDIMFLTARTEDYRELTLKQLDLIYPGTSKKYPVFFSREKGKTLRKILDNNEKKYERVVFIDDKEFNLKDVKADVPEAKCYRFNYMDYIYNFHNL